MIDVENASKPKAGSGESKAACRLLKATIRHGKAAMKNIKGRTDDVKGAPGAPNAASGFSRGVIGDANARDRTAKAALVKAKQSVGHVSAESGCLKPAPEELKAERCPTKADSCHPNGEKGNAKAAGRCGER